jgi:glutathione synthase/RimK-type ligase-like ATP-grasp enzyme
MPLRIATCRALPEPDEDEQPLLDALAARGVPARMAAWDDPGERWEEPIPTVIRSTWNYIHHLPAFLSWAERAARAAPLWNPIDVVRANCHKSYLATLAAAGHAVVPTRLFGRGSRVELAAVLAEEGISDVVIKPAVSAASFGTGRFAAGEEAAAQAHLDGLLAAGDALVQGYVASVEGYGERAVVWIDGALTHAVRKAPRFSGEHETVSGALPIAADERAAAEAALAPWAERLLYGRVDLARDASGRPMIMELELIEPSLFLVRHPPALARLADALARRA